MSLPRGGRTVVLAAALLLSGVAPASAEHHYPAADSGYHDYPEMVAHIQQLQVEHPDIVRVFSIGESSQGRTVWAVEVSDHVGVDEGEPEVMLDALHHAREHLGAEMGIYALDLLTGQYDQDGDLGRRVTDLVDGRRIWVIPMVNPDGLEYDLGGGPYVDGAYKGWRKNRQATPGSSAIGTDLNRNYGHGWTSPEPPTSRFYAGPKPFSAPETRAVRDFVRSRRVDGIQRIRTHITFHTAGQQILWPYSGTSVDVPPDMTSLDQRTLAAMATAMAATNGYTPIRSGDLEVKTGTEIDWLYGSQRIFTFTFELYPAPSRDVARFYPPDEVIARETTRNRDALLYLIDAADCPYRAVDKSAAYCGPLFDDLEIGRGWTPDPAGTDTASAGAWQRGDPAASARQLSSVTSGRAALVTGSAPGSDVDGGRTTIRSRSISLPDGQVATIRLRYWVGMSATAGEDDRFGIRLVRPSDGAVLATVLGVRGGSGARAPRWLTLTWQLPASLRGTAVAVELLAADAGSDATVEAGVDDVRITVARP